MVTTSAVQRREMCWFREREGFMNKTETELGSTMKREKMGGGDQQRATSSSLH